MKGPALIIAGMPISAFVGEPAVIYIFVTVFVAELIIRSVFPAIADEENVIHKLILFLIQLPATVGMMYWVAAIGIAGLSNYYLLAKEKQNAV